MVAEVGEDVRDGISCFQIQVEVTNCYGRTGATEIRIIDNDCKFDNECASIKIHNLYYVYIAMVIGFALRSQTVSESDHRKFSYEQYIYNPKSVQFFVHPLVTSARESEKEMQVLFRYHSSTAVVVSAVEVYFITSYDAIFGEQLNITSPLLEEQRDLFPGDYQLELQVAVKDDLSPRNVSQSIYYQMMNNRFHVMKGKMQVSIFAVILSVLTMMTVRK